MPPKRLRNSPLSASSAGSYQVRSPSDDCSPPSPRQQRAAPDRSQQLSDGKEGEAEREQQTAAGGEVTVEVVGLTGSSLAVRLRGSCLLRELLNIVLASQPQPLRQHLHLCYGPSQGNGSSSSSIRRAATVLDAAKLDSVSVSEVQQAHAVGYSFQMAMGLQFACLCPSSAVTLFLEQLTSWEELEQRYLQVWLARAGCYTVNAAAHRCQLFVSESAREAGRAVVEGSGIARCQPFLTWWLVGGGMTPTVLLKVVDADPQRPQQPLVPARPRPAPSANGGLQLCVKSMSGKVTWLHVERSETIAMVKSRIQERDGIPLSQQRLIFDGQQLQDARTVADYNIQNDSVICLVLSIRGC